MSENGGVDMILQFYPHLQKLRTNSWKKDYFG